MRKTKKTITKEIQQNVVKMYQNNEPLTKIAEENDICVATINNIARRAGVLKNRRLDSKYDHNLIISLYKEGMTTREVAIKVGGSRSAVSDIILKNGCSRPRKVRDHIWSNNAKHCPKLTSDFINYLDGLVLSDGNLTRPSERTKTSSYSQDSVCYSWLLSIKNIFEHNGIVCSLKPVNNRPGQFHFFSHKYAEFYEQYHRWYPDGGEKRVPRDLDLTNKSMLKNWIYGDGTLCKTNLRLCTDSFPVEDTNFLIDQLTKIGFYFRKIFMGKSKFGKDKFRLSICKSTGLFEFFQYVGKSEITELSYKWSN